MNVEVNQDALAELKSKLTPKNAVKVIFGTLISLGAAAAVFAALSNPLKASKGIIKILMAAGILVLASKAGDIAEDHFKETIDDWSELYQDVQKEMKEEGDEKRGADSHAGRNSKQQPEKQRAGTTNTLPPGETAGAPVRWRWWSKKERNGEVREMVQEDVPERQESEGDLQGRNRESGSSGDQG